MTQPRDFAPISRDRSMRIRVAAAYLGVSGVLTLGFIGFFMVGGLLGDSELARAFWDDAEFFVFALGWGGGLLWSAWQLSRRKRRGGYAGIACYGLNLLSLVLKPGAYDLNLAVPILGIVAIVSAWSDLSTA